METFFLILKDNFFFSVGFQRYSVLHYYLIEAVFPFKDILSNFNNLITIFVFPE